jgi:hypothetical protein
VLEGGSPEIRPDPFHDGPRGIPVHRCPRERLEPRPAGRDITKAGHRQLSGERRRPHHAVIKDREVTRRQPRHLLLPRQGGLIKMTHGPQPKFKAGPVFLAPDCPARSHRV